MMMAQSAVESYQKNPKLDDGLMGVSSMMGFLHNSSECVVLIEVALSIGGS